MRCKAGMLGANRQKSESLQSASLVGQFSVATQESNCQAVHISPAGHRMYVLGLDGDDVNEYTLSTAGDVTTATHAASFSVADKEADVRGLRFSPDGLRMYVVGIGSDSVHQYALSNAWSVSSASFSQSKSVAAQDIQPQCVAFKYDGSKMYIAGNFGNDINQYTLSQAWDVSTASFDTSFSVSSQDGQPTSVEFSLDGAGMYVLGLDTATLYRFELGTPWDVSSAVLGNSKSVQSEESFPTGLSVRSASLQMYVVGRDTNTVYQYSLI